MFAFLVSLSLRWHLTYSSGLRPTFGTQDIVWKIKQVGTRLRVVPYTETEISCPIAFTFPGLWCNSTFTVSSLAAIQVSQFSMFFFVFFDLCFELYVLLCNTSLSHTPLKGYLYKLIVFKQCRRMCLWIRVWGCCCCCWVGDPTVSQQVSTFLTGIML